MTEGVKQMSLKKSLREKAKKINTAISERERDEMSHEIEKRVLSSGDFAAAGSIFIYLSTEAEPSTARIIEKALSLGKQVAVPVCGENGLMTFVTLHEKTVFRSNRFGILQPLTGQTVYPENETDLCIMPCVAASENGNRLGHAGGYYDRFLAENPCRKMLLCFSPLILPGIPAEEHDIRPDVIVTDRGIFPY